MLIHVRLEQLVERFHQKSLTIPKKVKAKHQIAHAKQANSTRARKINHGNGDPIRVHENGVLDFVKVGRDIRNKVLERIVFVWLVSVDYFVIASATTQIDLDLIVFQLEHAQLKPNKYDVNKVHY